MSFFKKNKTGIIGTVIFHVLIVAVMLLMGFSTQLPLPEEESILVNFGTDDMGVGDVQPERVESIPAPQQAEQVETTEEILTQEFEDAPFVETTEKKHEVVEQEIVETQEEIVEERVVNPDMLFNNDKYSNNSNGEGNDKTGTDKGKEDGNPNADSYVGSNVPGSGISYDLTGRNPQSLPKPQYNCDESGKVVVEIKVDRFGKVVNAEPGQKGSTTHAKCLWDSAKKAALTTKFNKQTKESAADFQIGTITYTFILQ